MFGSCRVGDPQAPPYTLPQSEHPEGFGIDALWALSRRLQAGIEEWPDCLLLLGDQVYADETSVGTRAFIAARRDIDQPPGQQVADFEEYTRLYREAWSDPDIRWLLATVPSTMIFDDHDVHDDWNISEAWVRDMRATELVGGAHHGRVHVVLDLPAPRQPRAARSCEDEAMLAAVYEAEDGGPALRRFARAADRDTTASRFAFHRDFGRSRLVVDRLARSPRARRRRAGHGRRRRVAAGSPSTCAASFDHLIIASTLPVFMLEAIHYLEAWNEAVCAGAWGGLAARLGEKLRRALDLEHWPAFQRSFATHGRAAARARRGRRTLRARSS